jgi:hypothetical protein
MTDGERRIVEFLIASNATEMADLPDWLLDPEGEVSVRLSEEDWRFFNSAPTDHEVLIRMQRRWGLN